MLYVVAAVAIPVLWVVAYLVQQRVGVSRNWVAFDIVFGIVVAVVVSIQEAPTQGVLIGLLVIPLLVLFSVVRTVHLRYIERKTQAILDSTPGMREAYERRDIPSRRDRRAVRSGGAPGRSTADHLVNGDEAVAEVAKSVDDVGQGSGVR